jgi:hypothetical protein
VTLQAGQPGDVAISRWYGKVLARAVADQLAAEGGSGIASASYNDGSGVDSNGGADVVRATPPVTPLAARTCERIARSRPVAASLSISTARTLGILGGTCVFVVKTSGDPTAFVSDAAARLGALVSAIPTAEAHPYVVQVVDPNGELQLVLGWVPGLGGDIGQGLGWVRPGTRSSAILGMTAGAEAPTP